MDSVAFYPVFATTFIVLENSTSKLRVPSEFAIGQKKVLRDILLVFDKESVEGIFACKLA